MSAHDLFPGAGIESELILIDHLAARAGRGGKRALSGGVASSLSGSALWLEHAPVRERIVTVQRTWSWQAAWLASSLMLGTLTAQTARAETSGDRTRVELRIIDARSGSPLAGARVKDDQGHVLGTSGLGGGLQIQLPTTLDGPLQIERNGYRSLPLLHTQLRRTNLVTLQPGAAKPVVVAQNPEATGHDGEHHDDKAHGHEAKADHHDDKAHGHEAKADHHDDTAHGHEAKADHHDDKAHGHETKADHHDDKAHGHEAKADHHAKKAHGHEAKADHHAKKAHGHEAKADHHAKKAHGHEAKADPHAKKAHGHEAKADPHDEAAHAPAAPAEDLHGEAPQAPATAEVVEAAAHEDVVEATVPPAPADKPRAASSYRVRRGDSLWSIATRELGSGYRWRSIVALNQDSLPNPRLIQPGMTLEMPTSGAARSIKVRPGDSLWLLAERHLGSGQKWRSLYQLNRGKIANPSVIRVGTRLLLP
ncbi:MAG: LysM peptidoglycan-binding domain-containing protein [bacterium]|nr:LysM peptidoglycan-binding domain-containing protein [bacterium]